MSSSHCHGHGGAMPEDGVAYGLVELTTLPLCQAAHPLDGLAGGIAF